MRRAILIVPAALLACALAAADARADRIERGVVVAIEGRILYIDIGRARGLDQGHRLRLKRKVTLRHPVSGKKVTDELPIAAVEARVGVAGDTLTMATVTGALAKKTRVGDIVEVLVPGAPREPAPEPDPPRPPDQPAEPLPEVDPATKEVLQVWAQTAGLPLSARIDRWRTYLREHPDSPHAGAIRHNLEVLAGARDALDTSAPQRPVRHRRVNGLEHAPAERAPRAEPLPLAFLVTDAGVRAAWVHYRTAGSPTFRKLPLRADGDAYLRGELPADAVESPGVEYFVEAATTGGAAGAAIGSASSPVHVEVEAPTRARVFAERARRSRVSVSGTYLDLATFDERDGDHTDRFFLFEADFLYRLRAGPLHGIRSGFGVLQGEGGYVDDPPEEAGFTYGYVETELRPSDRREVAFLARGVAGLGAEGVGLGAEGRIRLGAEEKTNVTFGASTLEQVGFLSEIRMQFVAVPELPVGLAVGLTDRPNRGDLAVRMSVDVGWRALPWVAPMIRLSYQGRDARHSGVGGGLSMVFDW